jgi:hypothetical protein
VHPTGSPIRCISNELRGPGGHSVCIWDVFVLHVHLENAFFHLYSNMQVHPQIHTYTYIHTYIHKHTQIQIHTHTHIPSHPLTHMHSHKFICLLFPPTTPTHAHIQVNIWDLNQPTTFDKLYQWIRCEQVSFRSYPIRSA